MQIFYDFAARMKNHWQNQYGTKKCEWYDRVTTIYFMEIQIK